MRRHLGVLLSAAAVLGGTARATPASAQTIRGYLLDGASDRPIDFGLVIMRTEAGDSIAYTLTDSTGYFSITSIQPGSFTLLASALGYRETPAGVFDLAMGGELKVEFRLPAAPLPLDELLITLDRPVLEHALIRNGFVRRYQRGEGHFITPFDIETSAARSTEALLGGVHAVQVRPPPGQRSSLGDRVYLRSTTGGWCTPAVYVDGMRSQYVHADGLSLSMLAPLETIAGIEVYRSPAEVPVEYNATRRIDEGGPAMGVCGVLVVWTRRGR